MKIGLLTHDKALENNKIFDYKDKTINRDNGLYPCYLIKKNFESKSIKFNTIDTYYESDRLDYVFYFKYDENVLFKHRNSINVYFAWEPEVVDEKHSKDQLKKLAKQFDYIMTWNDDIVDNKIFFKIDFPYHFCGNQILYRDFEEKKLLTNISGNKISFSNFELYSERLRVIEYFENYSDDFDFYGTGWQTEKYKNYKGMCDSKFEVYNKYKFALCLENMYNVNGYITEKILDCFNAEIVPIYKGAKNIQDYIPQGCYIEYDKFKSIEELHHYLKNITEEKYLEYIENIKTYKKDERKFSAERMAENILKVIQLDKKRIKVSTLRINMFLIVSRITRVLKRIQNYIVKFMGQL